MNVTDTASRRLRCTGASAPLVALACACSAFLFAPVLGQNETDDAWRPRPVSAFSHMTREELQDHGRRRAELDYAKERAEIEVFGMESPGYVDWQTGLYLRSRRPRYLNRADIESDAYNERLRELVAEKGVPANAAGIKERYDKVRSFIELAPDLHWVKMPWFTEPRQAEPAALGPFDVWIDNMPDEKVREFVKIANSLHHQHEDQPAGLADEDLARVYERVLESSRHQYGPRLMVAHDSELWAITPLEVNDDLAVEAARWDEPNIIILKWRQWRHSEEFLFIDAIHGRKMWRWRREVPR